MLSQNQLQSLQKHIQEIARLRCIPATVTVTEEQDGEEYSIRLTSTPFNTVPVLHSEITLCDFGGYITKDDENENIINVFVRVSARYEGNGVHLFTVSGFFRNDVLEGGKLYQRAEFHTN